jgi:hypothetical protein
MLRIAILLLAALLPSGLQGQGTAASPAVFEGSLTFVVSRYDTESGALVARHRFPIEATPSSLRITGLQQSPEFRRAAPPGATELLARHEQRELFLIGPPSRAVQFRDFEMRLLGAALQAGSWLGLPMQLPAPRNAGRFQLRDLKVVKWVYDDTANAARHEIYWTDAVNLKWGLLAESWLAGADGLKNSGLSEALARGLVPARIESYESGKMVMRLDLVDVRRRSMSPARFELPPGAQVISPARMLLEMLPGR